MKERIVTFAVYAFGLAAIWFMVTAPWSKRAPLATVDRQTFDAGAIAGAVVYAESLEAGQKITNAAVLKAKAWQYFQDTVR